METGFLSSGNSAFWLELNFYLWKPLQEFWKNSFQRKCLKSLTDYLASGNYFFHFLDSNQLLPVKAFFPSTGT